MPRSDQATRPIGDHLLTPQNAAMVLIDYQPSQFALVRSMDRDLLLENAVSTVEIVDSRPCRSSPTPDSARGFARPGGPS
jgi:hypothetical protein